jgi:hypothetical protein
MNGMSRHGCDIILLNPPPQQPWCVGRQILSRCCGRRDGSAEVDGVLEKDVARIIKSDQAALKLVPVLERNKDVTAFAFFQDFQWEKHCCRMKWYLQKLTIFILPKY